MRDLEHIPPPPGPLRPLPVAARPGETLVAAWCRQLATSVADTLHAAATDVAYRLTPRDDLPVPHLLHTAFTVTGHQVLVTVAWDDPWQEPGFAVTVDGAPAPMDAGSPGTTAALLAHATWQAIQTPAPPPRPAGSAPATRRGAVDRGPQRVRTPPSPSAAATRAGRRAAGP